MKREKWIYALRTKERIQAFREAGLELRTDRAFLDRWLNIKSLTNLADTQEWLSYENITLDEFTFALKPFEDYEKSILADALKKAQWYKNLEDILNHYKDQDSEKMGLSGHIAYVIGPFIYDFTLHMKSMRNSLKNYEVHESTLVKLIDFVANDLSGYAIKVVTWEMHLYKEQHPELYALLEDPEGGFKHFLKACYGQREQLLDFYEKYPTMTRKIISRLEHLKEHFKNAFERLDQSYEEIEQRMAINSKVIVDMDCGQGDSHQGGQAVLAVTFENERKLLYKPKNLIIEKKFYELMDWFSIHGGESLGTFKTISSIYKSEYTITQFINSEEAQSEEDLKHFYRKLGQYLMVMYSLGGNDIHFENIVASGNSPYIIDLETLFQDTTGIYQSNNLPEEKIIQRIAESVLSIGILPIIGLNQNVEGKGVDISGLNGMAQKLPFKVLKPKSVNTTEMSFVYDFAELKGGKNIPIINGELADSRNYMGDLIEGFTEMFNFMIVHKVKIAEVISKLFGGEELVVRLLIKATANYAALNNYSNHPNYLGDMVYSEKLYENLMSYPYSNRKIVISEMKAMHHNDIPVFFRTVDGLELIDGFGNRLEGHLLVNPLKKTLSRVLEFDEKALQRQLEMIKISLNIYRKENEKKINRINGSLGYQPPENTYDTYLKEVNQRLGEQLLFNDGKTDLNWAVVDKGTSTLAPLDFSLLDGLSGAGAYYYELYKYTKDENHRHLYEMIKKKLLLAPARLLFKTTELLTSHYFLGLIYKEEPTEDLKLKLLSVLRLYERLNQEIHSGTYNVKENGKNLVLLAKCLWNTHSLTQDQPCLLASRELAETLYPIKEHLDMDTRQILDQVALATGVADKAETHHDFLDHLMKANSHEIWKRSCYDTYETGVMMPIHQLLNAYESNHSEGYREQAKALLNHSLHGFDKHRHFRIFKAAQYEAVSLNEGLMGIGYSLLRLLRPLEVKDVFMMNL